MAKKSQLEEQILQVAESLFLQKGFDSTTTTDIARMVGCNQALVHYYFRTKENLFQQIFQKNFQKILEFLTIESIENQNFNTAICAFVDNYFDFLTKNKNLPFFFIKELLLNEERRQLLKDFILADGRYLKYYTTWDGIIKKEIAAGEIREIDTMDLTLSVLSLMAFTFISLPIYSDFFGQDEAQIEQYIQHRKAEIKNFIFESLKPKKK